MGTCMIQKKPTRAKTLALKEVVEKEELIFPDMPEWEGKEYINIGEKYRGVGIKRMKGYKCDIPINELNNLREAFWGKIKLNP
jgi:hypothetical protein